jgi:hypothetical protein
MVIADCTTARYCAGISGASATDLQFNTGVTSCSNLQSVACITARYCASKPQKRKGMHADRTGCTMCGVQHMPQMLHCQLAAEHAVYRRHVIACSTKSPKFKLLLLVLLLLLLCNSRLVELEGC